MDVKVALVHDWLTGMRGGEKVLEVLCGLYPQADLFTLLHVPGSVSPTIEAMRIHTSFIQRLPFAAARYRAYLPLFACAIERFNFSGYDLIVSSSHCVAKGAQPPPGAPHVCYCHTPMRYVWDLFDHYFGGSGRAGAKRRLAGLLAARLRRWDVQSSARVTHFIANSRHVADRIRRHYAREATVIHPPVDCARFPLAASHWTEGAYYLSFGALAPYKRVDVAVRAAEELRFPLWVVGSGQDEHRLRRLAGMRVRFLSRVPDEEVPALYAGCRALLFTAEEDFGIVPLEAAACGRPVVAFGRGGALESVVAPGGEAPATGVFFDEQTPESLVAAVRRLEEQPEAFDPAAMRARALEFDRPLFRTRLAAFLRERLPAALHPAPDA